MAGSTSDMAESGPVNLDSKLGIVVGTFGVIALCVPLLAHHGAASFDTSKMVTVTGTVTEYIWTNPHVLVKLDAKDESGNVSHWVVEAWNPVTQASRGWSKNTFKPGDDVSLDINPAKNGQPIGEIITAVMTATIETTRRLDISEPSSRLF